MNAYRLIPVLLCTAVLGSSCAGVSLREEDAPTSSPKAVVDALATAVADEDCHAVARLLTAPFGPALLQALESGDQLEAATETLVSVLATRFGEASADRLAEDLASARKPYSPFSGTLELIDLRDRGDRAVARMRCRPEQGTAREFDLHLRRISGSWLVEATADEQSVPRLVAAFSAHRTRMRALALRYERAAATVGFVASRDAVAARR